MPLNLQSTSYTPGNNFIFADMVVKFHCLIKCMVTLSVLYILQHKGAKTNSEQMLNEHTMAAYEMCAFTYSTLSTAQCTVSQKFQDQLLSHSSYENSV